MLCCGNFLKRMASFAVATCAGLSCGMAADLDGQIQGWISEPGVTPPSYAVTTPVETNLNVDTVLLLCGEAGGSRSLELDIYLVDEGPLLPERAAPEDLKDRPKVEIAVDGRTFAASVYFAEDHVVVADTLHGVAPSLSNVLLDAMQHGQRMVIRFDLLRENGDHPELFDSQIMLDVGEGHAAIAAVRGCASSLMNQAQRLPVSALKVAAPSFPFILSRK